MRTRSKLTKNALAVFLIVGLTGPGVVSAQDDAQAATKVPSSVNDEKDAKKQAPKGLQFTKSEKAFDATLIRPFDFCGLLVSSAAFIPAAILTLPSGRESIENAYDLLVLEPKENVFNRPLGEL